MHVTQEDYTALKDIQTGFLDNVRKNADGDAYRMFKKQLRLKDYWNIMTSKAGAGMVGEQASPERKARALMKYNASVLPSMKRAFGEEFLVTALPANAGEQRVVELCRHLDANDVADLCEKRGKLDNGATAAAKQAKKHRP